MSDQPSDLPADNRLALRQVVRACRKAMLATLDADGAPYASLVTVAVDHDLAPILLLSELADHTRNLAGDGRVSLLFDGTAGHPNPQTGPRVTLTGVASATDDGRLAARFLARHPGAAQYAGFGDFGFRRIEPARAHFVGGFGRAVWFDVPFGQPAQAAAAMAAAEADILEHVNGRHASALDLFAHALCGEDGTGWRMVGIDLDGADLALDGRFARLSFECPLAGPDAARDVLADLVRRHNM